MSVFNKKISENIQERKFVGANIPLHIYSYLTMYALAAATSKSSIINDLIVDWYNDEVNHISIPTLEKEIVKQAVKAFKASEMELSDFTLKLKEELDKKGVLQPSIDNIIKLFTDEAKK